MAATSAAGRGLSSGGGPFAAPYLGPTVLFLTLSCYAVPPAAEAGEWTLTPRLSVEEVFTDNVGLSSTAQREDFITDVSPGLSLHGEGARLVLDFDYTLQTVFHARESEGNAINQQLQAIGTAELVKQIAFVDLRSSMSQENASNVGRISSDNLAVTAARTDVFTFSVSPYVRHHIGTYVDSEARYTFDTVTNDGAAGETTSKSQTLRLDIRSGRRFARMPWSLSVNRQTIDNTDDSTTRFKQVNGTLQYNFTRRYAVNASAGIESNDFATSQSSQDGARWDVSFTWRPTSRTSIQAGFGDRFFGSTTFFNISHRSRRTQWVASFNEDTTTTRQLQLERRLVALVDPFGNPIPDPVTGDPLQVPVDFLVPTDEVIVARRFDGTVAMTGRRTNITLAVFNDNRDFQLTGDNETALGGSLAVDRRLSRRTTARLSGSWQKTEPRAGGREDQRWSVDASLSHVISRSLSGTVTYRHARQTTDVGLDEFDENRVSARLNVRF